MALRGKCTPHDVCDVILVGDLLAFVLRTASATEIDKQGPKPALYIAVLPRVELQKAVLHEFDHQHLLNCDRPVGSR